MIHDAVRKNPAWGSTPSRLALQHVALLQLAHCVVSALFSPPVPRDVLSRDTDVELAYPSGKQLITYPIDQPGE
jgi:hypothetical protein